MRYKFALVSVFALILLVVIHPSSAEDAVSQPSSVGNASANQDQPTIAKDSVQVTAFTVNEYKKNYDFWSWLPRTEFA